jgi:hypothetical protein
MNAIACLAQHVLRRVPVAWRQRGGNVVGDKDGDQPKAKEKEKKESRGPTPRTLSPLGQYTRSFGSM